MNISQSQPSPTPVLQQSTEVYAPQKSDNGIIVLYVFRYQRYGKRNEN